MRKRKQALVVSLALAAALTLGGCASDDDPDSTLPNGPTTTLFIPGTTAPTGAPSTTAAG
jgi:hypothetical protein